MSHTKYDLPKMIGAASLFAMVFWVFAIGALWLGAYATSRRGLSQHEIQWFGNLLLVILGGDSLGLLTSLVLFAYASLRKKEK